MATPRIIVKGCEYGKSIPLEAIVQLFITTEMRRKSHEKAGLDKRKNIDVQMAQRVVHSVGNRPS